MDKNNQHIKIYVLRSLETTLMSQKNSTDIVSQPIANTLLMNSGDLWGGKTQREQET